MLWIATLIGMIATSHEFVILDVETTGIDPAAGHEIIEIGAERLRNGEVVESFDHLVLPTRPIDPDAQRVSGITEEMLAGKGRPASEVIPEFVAFAGNAILVGHNVGFDSGFVNAHLDRLQLPRLANRYLDTIAMAKRLLIIPSYSLERVAKYLKIPQPMAHRALADVQTTRQVFLRLLERQQAKA